MLRGRKFLLVLILALVGLLLLLSVSIPVEFREQVSVPLGMTRTVELFTNKSLLAKWVVPGISSGNDSVHLIRAQADRVKLAYHVDGEDHLYEYRVERRSDVQRSCMVTLSQTSSLWKNYFDADPVDRLAFQSLTSLQDFANDPKKLYGYRIVEGKSTDSSFLIITRLVPLTEKYSAPVLLFDSLIQFANHRFMRYNGNRYMTTFLRNNGSVQVTTGIGMDGYPELRADDPVTRKTTPPHQTQLELDYTGRFEYVDLAYKALDQYRRDHSIIATDIPLEMLISPGYGFAAGDTVTLKLCVPFGNNR